VNRQKFSKRDLVKNSSTYCFYQEVSIWTTYFNVKNTAFWPQRMLIMWSLWHLQ